MGKSKTDFMEQREAETSYGNETTLHPSITNEITRYIKPLHLNKEEARESASLIADMVRNGEAGALDVLTRLRWMQDVIEQSRELLREDAVTEVMRHAASKAVVNGAKIEKVETGTKYLYDTSSDPVWQRLDQALASAKQTRDARETFLKALPEPTMVADPETGEMVEIRKPQKISTTNIKITFS